MVVACALGYCDTCGERRSRFDDASGFGEELAVLKIRGDVIGMRSHQRLKIFVRGVGVAAVGTFHGQAIASERVRGFGSDEFFEHLAARFLLWLGRSHVHSIFAVPRNAKCEVGRTAATLRSVSYTHLRAH